MLDSWAMNIDRSLVKAVVFLDFTRAFHTVVDLDILTRKLQYFGMCRSRLNGLLLTQIIELKFVQFFGIRCSLSNIAYSCHKPECILVILVWRLLVLTLTMYI